jgi:hypothetical protein
MNYTKLFNSILDSTIWQEPPPTKLVWITMLAMSDRNGDVHASIPGLAKRAGVEIRECQEALECLLSPDEYSRTKDHEGRRIAEIDGGFTLLNHGKYRALLSAEERREYNRRKQAERRERMRAAVKSESTPVKDVNYKSAMSTHTEAEAEAEIKIKPAAQPAAPTIQQAISAGTELMMTEQAVRAWHAKREADGWMIHRNNGHQTPVANWRKDLAASKAWAMKAGADDKTAKKGKSMHDYGI